MKGVLPRSALSVAVILALGVAPVHAQRDATISLLDVPLLGERLAPVVMVEFSDFHCPFCRTYFKDAFPQIKKDYIEKGTLLYAFRHFPLDIHPRAPDAAVAAMCAAREGRFWEIHDRFFSAPRPVAPGDLERHARSVGLDLAKFRTCTKAGLAREDVRLDTMLARQLGLNGTPAFAIGYRDDTGERMRVVRRIAGGHPYEVFKKLLDEVIAGR